MRQNASVETPRRSSGICVSAQKWPRPTSTLANMRSGRSLQRQSEEFIHRKEWSGGAPWLTLEAPRSAIVGSIHGGFGSLNAVDRPNNHRGGVNRGRSEAARRVRAAVAQAMVTSPRMVELLALWASGVVSGPKASPPAASGSLLNSTRNRPKKIGIWSSTGRQEENGLAPASL